LRQAVGSLLVVGLSGTELTSLERAWLRLVRPAGVILFRRNIKDAEQTRALLDEATGLCTRNSVRYVDVEGGTVNRLRDALAPLPSAQAVGAAAREQPKLAREFGELIARAVKAFGFNTTLAPVVDLALPESAEVMGSRCAAPDPAHVIVFAREFMRGLEARRVIACGKHFPGLGGAASDTHFETPEIHRTWQQLWDEDLAPYRELHQQMPIVMTNHAAYPETPGRNMLASGSRFWITTVLRKRIGYRGMILSDDLEMGGVLKVASIGEAAVEFVRAGGDLCLVCHEREHVENAFETMVHEYERKPKFRKRVAESARRVTDFKRKQKLARPRPAPSAEMIGQLSRRLWEFSEQIRFKQLSYATRSLEPR